MKAKAEVKVEAESASSPSASTFGLLSQPDVINERATEKASSMSGN